LNVTGPLFAGPAGAQGIPWSAVLPLVVALPAIALLVLGLLRGRLPASFTAAGLLLPFAAYGLGSLYVMEGSKQTEFCGSCHIMTPILASVRGADGSLASIHYMRGLVPYDQACYTCHSGYGIWGNFDAKVAGLSHMARTVTGDYELPLKMWAPFDIDSCLGCHAHAPSFRNVEAHQDADLQKALLAREMSCTGVCHPEAHPASALGGAAKP
jgi:nitrate/TMAO reductase-like tetraheme cytochrome c subunit